MEIVGSVVGRVLSGIDCEGLTAQELTALRCEGLTAKDRERIEAFQRELQEAGVEQKTIDRQTETHIQNLMERNRRAAAVMETPRADNLIQEVVQEPAATVKKNTALRVNTRLLDRPEFRELSPHARLLFVVSFLRHVNRKTHECYHSWRTMMDETGLSEHHLRKALQELQARGAIYRTEPRKYTVEGRYKSRVNTMILWY